MGYQATNNETRSQLTSNHVSQPPSLSRSGCLWRLEHQLVQPFPRMARGPTPTLSAGGKVNETVPEPHPGLSVRLHPHQLEAEGCPRIPLPAEASPASIAGLLESPPLEWQRGMETLHRKTHRWFCAAAG